MLFRLLLGAFLHVYHSDDWTWRFLITRMLAGPCAVNGPDEGENQEEKTQERQDA